MYHEKMKYPRDYGLTHGPIIWLKGYVKWQDGVPKATWYSYSSSYWMYGWKDDKQQVKPVFQLKRLPSRVRHAAAFIYEKSPVNTRSEKYIESPGGVASWGPPGSSGEFFLIPKLQIAP